MRVFSQCGPGCRCAHPGYACCVETSSREDAERTRAMTRRAAFAKHPFGTVKCRAGERRLPGATPEHDEVRDWDLKQTAPVFRRYSLALRCVGCLFED
jgi:hypothetical protein